MGAGGGLRDGGLVLDGKGGSAGEEEKVLGWMVVMVPQQPDYTQC